MFCAKYIRWGRNNIFIFPSAGNVHCDVAVRITDKTPKSAGFVKIMLDGTVKCFGESVSLGLKSLPEDSNIAQKILTGDEI
jgi:hypothetical protein